jgi:acyl carrier protein
MRPPGRGVRWSHAAGRGKARTMTRDEIFKKVQAVVADALAVDEAEVTPEASLQKDLGAESIDILDISFKLEQAFGIKIGQGELVPEGVTQDPTFVKDGRVTPAGIAELKARLPHADFSQFEKDPQVNKVLSVFTVETIVRFVEKKLAS